MLCIGCIVNAIVQELLIDVNTNDFTKSPVSFECRCTEILQMKNLQGELLQTWMVFGEVIGVHIDEKLLNNGIYDTANAQHVLRGGGPADYFSIGPEQLFKLHRPSN